ncbi:hypothetical protein NA56DRAFT_644614 [Hyaloscypha hepaticicola]|uniref:2EXR domain-containing protein n=1 Tax=Hyaloscypha hepaticicola TaxID=2082293 RepID=A0A2J6Q9T4_9HELO|nr:hypothetical protein NA56DRAFT_644614 [Hyaloscypha hepaticicola]
MSDNTKNQDQTFPLFPKLPKEIRLMIWELTLPGPRIVHLQQRKLKTTIGEWEDESGLSWPLFPGDGEQNSGHRKMYRGAMRSGIRCALGMPDPSRKSSMYREASFLGLHSQTPPPETFAVCQEAFELGAGYIKMFSTTCSVAETWFNPEIDTLYIRLDDFWVYDDLIWRFDIFDPFPVTDVENLGRVKKLALYWDMSRDSVSIVTKHHEEDFEKGQGQEIIFWNPVDIDGTFADINSLISDPLSNATPEVPLLDTWVQDLEVLLEAYKSEFEEGTEVRLPSIVQKIAVTEGVWKRLKDGFGKLEKVLKEREVARAGAT